MGIFERERRTFAALDLLREMRASGLKINLGKDQKFYVSPRSKLSKEHAARLKDLRAEAAAVLKWELGGKQGLPEGITDPFARGLPMKLWIDHLIESGRIFDHTPSARPTAEAATEPRAECYSCRGTVFARKGQTEFVCIRCHPATCAECYPIIARKENDTHATADDNPARGTAKTNPVSAGGSEGLEPAGAAA
jgi:hypothetical protein